MGLDLVQIFGQLSLDADKTLVSRVKLVNKIHTHIHTMIKRGRERGRRKIYIYIQIHNSALS